MIFSIFEKIKSTLPIKIHPLPSPRVKKKATSIFCAWLKRKWAGNVTLPLMVLFSCKSRCLRVFLSSILSAFRTRKWSLSSLFISHYFWERSFFCRFFTILPLSLFHRCGFFFRGLEKNNQTISCKNFTNWF